MKKPDPEPAAAFEGHSVGLFRRLAALFYDGLVVAALLFVAAVPVVVLFRLDQSHGLYWLFVVYLYALLFGYLAWFWIHGGQTIGMKTWRIRLVSGRGTTMELPRAALRYLVALAFWLPAGFGLSLLQKGAAWTGLALTAPLLVNYAAVVTRADRMALHDILSGSKLVRVS